MRAVPYYVLGIILLPFAVSALARAVVQLLAIASLGKAYFGPVGLVVAALFLWPFPAISPLFYGGSLVALRGVITRPSSASALGSLLNAALGTILVIATAEVAGHLVGMGISWVADQDCARALAVGVTGNYPCG